MLFDRAMLSDRKSLVATMFVCISAFVTAGFAADATSFQTLEKDYQQTVRPILVTFCLKCHSTEKMEGELDLEQFSALAQLRKNPRVWLKVLEMLDNGEMPPKESPQLSPLQRKQLVDWARQYLHAEAVANAGDPGRVVLRRLSNVEYELTMADLIGVNLRPARQFPADGAAGEGFTNTGEALVMSPALIEKYFDAAKGIADHAVLLPEGFRFSTTKTRRDWTNELISDIRALYAEYTDPAGSRRVNLQGLNFEAESGGRIPLEAYLSITVQHRDALATGTLSFDRAAAEHHLSPKYLRILWALLTDSKPSPLLDQVRHRWRAAKIEDVAGLAGDIRKWQDALTRLNSVAHFKNWQEPVNPIIAVHPIRVKLPANTQGQPITLRLVSRDAGDGRDHDFVAWGRPRLASPNHATVLLKDVNAGLRALTAKRKTFQDAAKYLAAAAEVRGRKTDVGIPDLARERNLDPLMLQAWLDYLGVGAGTLRIETLFSERMESGGGYAFVQGWGLPATPSVMANASDQQVRIPGIVKPHTIVVHPAPNRHVAVGWQSPIQGNIRIEPRVVHAHPECGNGVAWFIQLRRSGDRRQLTGGEIDRAQTAKIDPIESLAVQPGDLVSLCIGPRSKDHTCDLTEIEMKIVEVGGNREWSLSKDVSPNILAGNPHADALGGPNVWHFYHEPLDAAATGASIPPGSLLQRWIDEPARDAQQILAEQLQQLLVRGPTADELPANSALFQQLTAISGPLLGRLDFGRLSNEPVADTDDSEVIFGLPKERFGKYPSGKEAAAEDLIMQTPGVFEVRLPADLAAGREFVVDVSLDAQAGKLGSIQAEVLVDQVIVPADLVAGQPVIIQDAEVRSRFEESFAEFRRVFPAAVCYPKIIPVDEVVTLVQFHRDDERLSQLMLDQTEHQRLEQLWHELRYVSQDAFKVQEAYGQFMEYVTQDGDVRLFEPLRKPINERAAAFRQQLLDSEPSHIRDLIDFASRAYRRPLSDSERQGLQKLYDGLRANEVEHEAAFRLTLARILVAPAFLYRVEQPALSDKPVAISEWELASRLSYFLWSTMPDEELRRHAAAGKLNDPDIAVLQMRRMLQSDKVRALATEFACQWLDVRGFDTLDEKNEQLFPDFHELRDDMYEETVRFFIDLIQQDRSLLEILDADYSIVNPALGKHYGIPVTGGAAEAQWQRVDGLKKHGRGGILGMATTLAKHSGASRTSPILRGNWVSEFLLGEKLPKPPKDVPQLPQAETGTELTVRQLVEKHREIASCAKCHDRIDPLGFALEGFDTVGRFREKDLAGRAIDTQVMMSDGTSFEGLDGLRSYLLNQRRDQFVRHFCRKLLGYALGRSVQISDDPLLDEMMKRLVETDYKFSSAVEVIVRSQQFHYQRGRNQEE